MSSLSLPNQARFRFSWPTFTVSVVMVVVSAAVLWACAHPSAALNWDEAHYINRIYRDALKFQSGGWAELGRVLLHEDVARPPALRLMVLPFTLLLGPSPVVARLVSLAFFCLTLTLVYRTAAQLMTPAAGAISAILLVLSPVVLGVSSHFYMEYTLYFAIAALFYALLRDWAMPTMRRSSWVGLGLAVGLGMLSKVSFAFVAVPVGLAALWLRWRQPGQRWGLFKAAGVGLLVMLPWWAFNFRAALSYALFSGNYVDHSLGPRTDPVTWLNWLYMLYQTVLGPAMFCFVVAVVISALLHRRLRQHRVPLLSSSQSSALWVCWVGALATPALSWVGSNHNPRLITGSMIPFVVAIGVLAAATGWTTRRWLMLSAVALVGFQSWVLVMPDLGNPLYKTGDAASVALNWGNPTSVMRRSDLWNWSSLKELADEQGLMRPSIVYLGGGGSLTPTQIRFPWVKAGENVTVEPLWQFSSETRTTDDLISAAVEQDIVITVPTWDHDNNALNAAFAEGAATALSDWRAHDLSLGQQTPTTVRVWLRPGASADADRLLHPSTYPIARIYTHEEM